MHILHFLPVYIPAWSYGGPILSVSRLCEGLVKLGVDVRVITTNAGLPDLPFEKLGTPQNINGVSVTYYAVNRHCKYIKSDSLLESLPSHLAWADVLHISSIWQPLGAKVQKAAHSAGIPVIQTLRGALGPYSWRQRWWKKVPYYLFQERPLLQRSSFIHCTTQQEAREIAWLNLKPPVRLLPNPLDLTQLSYDPEVGLEWRQRIGLSLTDTVFLVVGRLHHKKGLDLLPQALKGLTNPSWHLVFVGDDQDGTASRIKHKFRALGLDHRCHWLNSLPVDQLSGPYNGCDYLLLPSFHENFGNVVIEALACGCGAVITPEVAVSELLLHCPGVSTVPRQSTLWHKTLESVLDQQRPGNASATWVNDNFNSLAIAKSAISIYHETLSI